MNEILTSVLSIVIYVEFQSQEYVNVKNNQGLQLAMKI
jgi:hypothetical protein